MLCAAMQIGLFKIQNSINEHFIVMSLLSTLKNKTMGSCLEYKKTRDAETAAVLNLIE
jgi:hypothetical protein